MKNIIKILCMFLMLMSQSMAAQEDVIHFYDHYAELTKWIFPVAIDSNNRPKYFVKMTIVIELDSAQDALKIVPYADKIKEKIIEFCSTTKNPEYFNSPKGIYKIKNVLKDIISEITAPLKIKQVLISDIIIR
jgi:flagellar basal body-associated protein FliL